jgi:hypothetical protein
MFSSDFVPEDIDTFVNSYCYSLRENEGLTDLFDDFQ